MAARTRMKILVITLAGVGDALLSTPLLHELRENFPEATIDALVRWPAAKDLLENNPHLNRVHQKDLVSAGKPAAFRYLWSLRREHYDISINAHPQSRMLYRLAARVIGAPRRLSHDYECSGVLDRFLVNETLPQDYTRHSIDNNFDFLPLIGARRKRPACGLELFLTPEEEQWADGFMAEHHLSGRKILGVHVGSGGTKNLRFKRWPLIQYQNLFARLNRERPELQILLLGGPDEVRDHEILLRGSDRVRALEARTRTMRQTAALMKRCHAFLSVDTVLMHLAAAMKVPNQIVIEAPTLNVTNWPYGNPFTLVKNPIVNGRGLDYYRYDGGDIKGTPDELRACMASVTVEEVFQTVTKRV